MANVFLWWMNTGPPPLPPSKKKTPLHTQSVAAA